MWANKYFLTSWEESLGQTRNLLEGCYISPGLGMSLEPQQQLESVAGERDVWNILLTPKFHQIRVESVSYLPQQWGYALASVCTSTGSAALRIYSAAALAVRTLQRQIYQPSRVAVCHAALKCSGAVPQRLWRRGRPETVTSIDLECIWFCVCYFEKKLTPCL